MRPGLLTMYNSIKSQTTIREFMETCPYDELLEIDLIADTFKTVYHVEGKYFLPITDGTFSSFFRYATDHMLHPDDRESYREFLNPDTVFTRLRESETNGTLGLQFRIRSLDGSSYMWVEQVIAGGAVHGLPEGTILCYILDIQNIMNRRSGITNVTKSAEPLRDPLTGLLRERHYYSAAEKLEVLPGEKWIMIAIDLENFVIFNDWFGRDAGDMVLARIGGGLSQDAIQDKGLAGYMGNDDFCLYIPGDRVDPEELYRKVHSVIMRYGMSVGFMPAIGIAEADGESSVMDLYDRASIACHRAKTDRRNRICYFSQEMYRETEEEFRLLASFRRALDDGEICFFLQPQIRVSTGQVVGAESLARWRKPDGSFLPPVSFIPVLEKYGFITDLDQYIWEQVCIFCRRRLDEGKPLIPVSVNISQMDIFAIDVPSCLTRLLDLYELPRSAIKAEITESAYAEDSQKIRDTVEQLRAEGFLVMMDDFGSGYSSLNMLHELSVDTVKLDARFLKLDDDNEKKGIRILESVLNMTKTIGVPMIVEGVETDSQKQFLMSLGCRYIQGYCFYRPMPAEQFEELVSVRGRIDTDGIAFKANDQFGIREFLDETIYSDSMLNNILGPAAFYMLKDGQVDIVRFNEQFYEAVHVPDFQTRLTDIQRFMPPKDWESMLEMLETAAEDHMNGAGGVLTFYRADMSVMRFLMHFYYLDEGAEGKRFYGSSRDITEITNLQKHLELLSQFSSDCVLFLITRDGKYEVEVAAQGLEVELGLTKEELEEEIRSEAFYARVADEDRQTLFSKCMDAVKNERGFAMYVHIRGARGEMQYFLFKCDYIVDLTSDVRCVLSICRTLT